jgi:hypothetical protein
MNSDPRGRLNFCQDFIKPISLKFYSIRTIVSLPCNKDKGVLELVMFRRFEYRPILLAYRDFSAIISMYGGSTNEQRPIQSK